MFRKVKDCYGVSVCLYLTIRAHECSCCIMLQVSSMLENETEGASHSNKKKQQLETMRSMEHTEINKWPNSDSMCKSHMQ